MGFYCKCDLYQCLFLVEGSYEYLVIIDLISSSAENEERQAQGLDDVADIELEGNAMKDDLEDENAMEDDEKAESDSME